MILIVDMAQPEKYDSGNGGFGYKRKFEKITGRPCVTMNYPDVTVDFVEQYEIKAIFIAGFGYGLHNVHVEKLHDLWDVMHHTDVPTYGACGGHQLLGFIFNKNLRKVKALRDLPMRKLKPGEPDWEPGYHPGYFTERGIQTIEVLERDPLFAGLPRKMRLPEAHYCEIKKLPKDFVLIATNDNCRIQCMRHKTRPVYGAQFHAETWTDAYPHGKRVMENFFKIAGLME